MEINTFHIFLIVIIIIVALVLIILGIIYLIKCIRKRKNNNMKKEQQELSQNSTNETSQPSTNLSFPQNQNQNVLSTQKYLEKKIQTKEVKINAYCECFLKPVKYDLIKIYNDSCPIDLIKFNENDLISVTKCQHGFHYDCIKKYLLENEKNEEFKCPICLSPLFNLNEKLS